MEPKLSKLLFKTIVFFISLSIAWWLIKSGYLHQVVDKVLPVQFLAEITAGVFYTSFLTIPVAVAMFLVIAESNNPILVAILAGFGAVLGDFIILKFFREKLSKDVNTITHELHVKRINNILVKLRLEFITPLLGALIIASPLPDELGLMLLGASNLKYSQLAILTYILNTAGILLIVTPINLLS